MLKIIASTVVGMLLSASAFAHGDYEHHGWRGHHGHGHGYWREHGPRYYAPPPPPRYIREQVIYYPQPVPVMPAPSCREEVIYQAPPPPVYNQYRSAGGNPAGLVGGAIGGALGYQVGQGDPLAAGIGAATGSYLGNRMHH